MSDTHVMPIDDEIAHDDVRGCWCHPTVEEVWADEYLVIHHTADGREVLEDENPLPPAVRH